jgi:hypothetical protein
LNDKYVTDAPVSATGTTPMTSGQSRQGDSWDDGDLNPMRHRRDDNIASRSRQSIEQELCFFLSIHARMRRRSWVAVVNGGHDTLATKISEARFQ